MTLQLGDRAIYKGQMGTVVHLDPEIWTPDGVHSYVPVLGPLQKVGIVEPNFRRPNQGVLLRIRRWLATLPTNGGRKMSVHEETAHHEHER